MPAEKTIKGPSIRFDGIRKVYPGGAVAVERVDLTIEAGCFVALVGASGSGKSTLLKMINRLEEPSEGRVLVDDEPVDSVPPSQLRRRMGYVFQNIGLFPHLSVGENVAIGMRLRGDRDKAATSARVAELLELVDLPADYAGRPADALSGGQAQRVGVARALATEPRLMLMDEPFGALDPVTRDSLGKAVLDIHNRLGLTTIMVTHDMAEALLLADRVLVMDSGRIVADSTPEELVGGKGGEIADALVAVPREQAHRLNELEARA